MPSPSADASHLHLRRCDLLLAGQLALERLVNRHPDGTAGGMKVWPSVCILITGAVAAWSPQSKAYLPRVKFGQEAGSTAMTLACLPLVRF